MTKLIKAKLGGVKFKYSLLEVLEYADDVALLGETTNTGRAEKTCRIYGI